MLLDLVEVVEVLEDAVLEDRVELLLDGGQQGSRLQGVHALLAEGTLPVEGIQVVQVEAVEDVHDTGDDLGLVEGLVGDPGVGLGDVLGHAVHPGVRGECAHGNHGTFVCQLEDRLHHHFY